MSPRGESLPRQYTCPLLYNITTFRVSYHRLMTFMSDDDTGAGEYQRIARHRPSVFKLGISDRAAEGANGDKVTKRIGTVLIESSLSPVSPYDTV